MPFKMEEWEKNAKETGIPCFNCHERSGTDCPGRKPNEATLCNICFEKRMKEERKLMADHLRKCRKELRNVS